MQSLYFFLRLEGGRVLDDGWKGKHHIHTLHVDTLKTREHAAEEEEDDEKANGLCILSA
jgi:hypothetical protein